MDVENQEREMIAAAVVEGWVRARLGKRSIVVLALVLGHLCETFDVDPNIATKLVQLAHNTSKALPSIINN